MQRVVPEAVAQTAEAEAVAVGAAEASFTWFTTVFVVTPLPPQEGLVGRTARVQPLVWLAPRVRQVP